MCGIAGFVNFSSDLRGEKWQNTGKLMADSISHRGPDAKGVWCDKHAILSHARLSVIDIEGGTQPMSKTVDGYTYTIVYNGEIYNTKEIKRELLKDGAAEFTTHSDTEVILNAYIKYGPGCVHLLNGIFAFAIFDERKNELFLCRDRFGVKPLFFTRKNGFFVFASEIKALFKFPDIEPELDEEGLCEIFGIGPARTPGCGVFKGIFELPPATVKHVSKESELDKTYFKLHSCMHTDSFDETVDTVRYLLTDSIRRQTVSDVPLCTFLSGGLDSSLITAVTASHLSEPLCTYSFEYKDNSKYFTPSDFQPNSDEEYIKIMSEAYNTNHEVLVQDTDELVENLYLATEHKDLPGMADVDSSLLGFLRRVKNKHTVALSGECADEIFGGYPWFFRQEMLTCNTFPWCPDLSFRLKFLSEDVKRIGIEDYVHEKYTSFLSDMPEFPYRSATDLRRQEIAYLNLYWFMATLLDRKDRMSMASGLEVRVPFCDHRIVSYVWNIPWDMKAKDGERKHILREAARGLLPEKVRCRPKSPYPKTHNPDFEKKVKAELEKILENSASPLLHLINKEEVEKLINSDFDYGKPWFGQLMAGPQMIAYLIQVNHWLSHYKIKISL
ncbi:MAG: asparagine synthase (glutamine-hydrolyzing) [Clostridia bacterium]|nr:asparagine synthase (glutamine-hydrolyzing) [Clostridia bacterium]